MSELKIAVTGADEARVDIRLESSGYSAKVLQSEIRLNRALLDDFTAARDKLRTANREDFEHQVEDLGGRMFQALVGVVAAQAIVDQQNQARESNQRLRISLEFLGTDPRWAALPWESMRIVSAGLTIKLATDPHLSFARIWSLGRSTAIHHPTPDEPLRVLLLYSPNEDRAAGLQKPLIAHVEPTLERLTERRAIAVTRLDSATEHDLKRKLEQSWDIVHFIGHGRFESEDGGAPALAMNFNSGGSRWLPAQVFVDALAQNLPKFVFLQACETAAGLGDQVASSLAEKLIALDIPAVLAMQFKIDNHSAQEFAVALYEEIAAQRPLDIATQRARFQLGDAASVTPVLHLRPGTHDVLRVEPPSELTIILTDLKRKSDKLQTLKAAHFKAQEIQGILNAAKSKLPRDRLREWIDDFPERCNELAILLVGINMESPLAKLMIYKEKAVSDAKVLVASTINEDDMVALNPSRVEKLEQQVERIAVLLNQGLLGAVTAFDVDGSMAKLRTLLGAKRVDAVATELSGLHADFAQKMAVHDLLQALEQGALDMQMNARLDPDDFLATPDVLPDPHGQLQKLDPIRADKIVLNSNELYAAIAAKDAAKASHCLREILKNTRYAFQSLDREMLALCGAISSQIAYALKKLGSNDV